MFWLYHSYLLFHTIKCRAYQSPHPTISITAVYARYNTAPLSSLNNPLNRACLSRPSTPSIHSATQSLCRRQTAISGLCTRFSLWKKCTGWKSGRLTGKSECALTSPTIPLIRPYSICSTHGRNKPPNWNRVRLPKRNTTSGGTSTRNWTHQGIGRKFPHRRSVICLWKNYRKSRKKKRKNRKRRKHKKDLADIQFPYLKISKVFLYHLMKLFSAWCRECCQIVANS